jgi:serine protease Do
MLSFWRTAFERPSRRPSRNEDLFLLIQSEFVGAHRAPDQAASIPLHRRRGGLIALAVAACLATLAPSAPAWAAAPPWDFSDLAAKLLPTVVNISARSKPVETKKDTQEEQQPPAGSPFEEFFKEFMERNGQGEQSQRRGMSVGSGFVIDAEKGYVVTNNHVIVGEDPNSPPADEIKVTLQNEKSFTATVVGRDVLADVAVLKITPSPDLVAVNWGDSNAARVGEWVLAIGEPFALSGTVSAGIISARNRDIGGRYDNYIQTDASINKGNSGGPLFNMKGEVIGITSLIYSPSGGSIGLGFAHPSSEVRPIIAQLIQNGKAKRGWLGVAIQSVDQDIADSLGLKNPAGALVSSVQPKSPAAAAGIQPNDVILTFDGKDVQDSRHLPRLVVETPIDHEAQITLWRDGKELVKSIKVAEMPEAKQLASIGADDQSKGGAKKDDQTVTQLGLGLASITAEARQRYQLGDDVSGVLVTSVTPDSVAAEKQLTPGDVLLEVNQQEVKAPKDVVAKVDEARKDNKKSVLLLVQGQGGESHFVALPIAGKSKG